MAGLTTAGFERLRLDEIKTIMEEALKARFGADIDLRAESVFGQIVGVLAQPFSDLWEELENVFLAFDPDYAEGVALDALASLTGARRIAATKTTVFAALFGTLGATIPLGAEAVSEAGDVYSLTAASTISLSNLVRAKVNVNSVQNSADYTVTINGVATTITSDSSATEDEILLAFSSALTANPIFSQVNTDKRIVLAQSDFEAPFTLSVSSNLTISEPAAPGLFAANVPGARFVPAGSLNQIQTGFAGWASVLNYEDGITGINREEDPRFRVRRRNSVSLPAIGTDDALRARLLQLLNVRAAVVYSNDGEVTDGNGVPRQHIWAIVLGGDPVGIADIIYRTKAGGIGTHGAELVNYQADNGQDYDIRFERPTELPLYVTMTIKPTSELYEGTTPEQIQAAIALWVAETLSIGDSLRYSRIFTPINSIRGFEVLELKIGTAPSPTGETSIVADVNEIIVADTTRIIITVDS